MPEINLKRMISAGAANEGATLVNGPPGKETD